MCQPRISPRSRGTMKLASGTSPIRTFPGLVAEAETQQQLVQKVRDLVPDLYDANRHLARQDHARGEVAIQLTLKRLETIKLAMT